MGRNPNRRRPDHWTKKAKAQGFEARSVFKLAEINKRHQLLGSAKRVVDFGCAPGSWSQFVQRTRKKVSLVGIDIQPVVNYCGHFLHASIEDISPEEIVEHLGGQADVVLSDMAPKTTGDRFGDHVRQVEVARLAFERAIPLLAPGGHFVVKIFQGEDAPGLVKDIRAHFTTSKRFKPKSTRSESVEFFLIAKGKKKLT